MGTFPPNKVKNYLSPMGVTTIIRDNNGNVKDIIVKEILTTSTSISSLQLGETNITAYRGDRGKEAYDHSKTVHTKIYFSSTEPINPEINSLWVVTP